MVFFEIPVSCIRHHYILTTTKSAVVLPCFLVIFHGITMVLIEKNYKVNTMRIPWYSVKCHTKTYHTPFYFEHIPYYTCLSTMLEHSFNYCGIFQSTTVLTSESATVLP